MATTSRTGREARVAGMAGREGAVAGAADATCAVWAGADAVGAGRTGRGVRNMRRFETSLTFSRKSFSIRTISSDTFESCLGMKSTAPSSSALRVASAPSVVSELTISTGRGISIMICRNVVSPSIRGISMSSVTTSGLCWRMT